nr:hypothetical protein [Nodosilinea nodulosa]
MRSRNGKIFLVDFGSVNTNRSAAQSIDSTFVGAYGYAPLEQLYGKACLNSDLYGLGATLLFLITGNSPEPCLTGTPKLNLKGHPQLSNHWIKWLEKMLEPSSNARFHSASEAMTALQNQPTSEAQPNPRPASTSSSGSKVSDPHSPMARTNRLQRLLRPRPANSRVIISHTDTGWVEA